MWLNSKRVTKWWVGAHHLGWFVSCQADVLIGVLKQTVQPYPRHTQPETYNDSIRSEVPPSMSSPLFRDSLGKQRHMEHTGFVGLGRCMERILSASVMRRSEAYSNISLS